MGVATGLAILILVAGITGMPGDLRGEISGPFDQTVVLGLKEQIQQLE